MTEITIKAALTADEWTTARRRIAEYEGAGWHVPGYYLAELAQWQRGEPMQQQSTHAASRHTLAALCLYGQPFGFTAEDVAFLREMQAQAIRGRGGLHAVRFGSIADRIAALLPE